MTDIIQEARGLLHDFETESGSIAQAAGGMFFLVDRTAWTKLFLLHYLNQETQVGHAGKAELLGIDVELADLTEGEPEIRLLRKPDCTNPATAIYRGLDPMRGNGGAPNAGKVSREDLESVAAEAEAVYYSRPNNGRSNPRMALAIRAALSALGLEVEG